MKKLIFFFLFIFFIVDGHSSTKLIQANKNTIVSKNFADTIAVEFFNYNIIVPVTINGEIKRFIFDTGSHTFIFENLAKEIDSKGKQDKAFSRLSDGKIRAFPLIQLDYLKVGNTEFKGVWATQDKDSAVLNIKPFLDVDGIIGSDILSTVNIKLDMRNKQMIITDNDDLFHADDTYKQAMRISAQGTPYIKMTFWGKDEEVLFDTGDNDMMGRLKEKNLVKLKEEGKLKEENIKQTYYNGKLVKEEIIFPSVKINKIEVKNYKATYPSKTYTTLGSAILHVADVVINNRKKEFWLIPHNETTQIALPQSWGFSSQIKDGKYIISEIEDNSVAQRAGLQKNSEVKSVNGHLMRSNAMIDLLRTLDIADTNFGSSIKLVIVDDKGEEKEYILER